MKDYFKECRTLDEAKNLFRKLAKEFHPDKATNKDTAHSNFIELKKQFDDFTPSRKYSSDSSFNKRDFYRDVEQFNTLYNINISFVGSFMWLTDAEPGAMYKQRKEIKSIKIDGYNSARWARKKISWYFSPIDYKKTSKKSLSMDKIKSLFGSEERQTKTKIYLT